MTPNPHRVSWLGRPGTTGRVCGACGAEAKTVRAQQIHADVYEPRPLDTKRIIKEGK